MRLDQAARQFIGVPFAHQGRNPAVALDCIGLACCSFAVAGMTRYLAFDRVDYARTPHGGLLEAQLAAALGAPVDGLQPGDLAAFRMGGAVRHVGIIAEGNNGLNVIHTWSDIGRVVEHRLDDKWRRRIAYVYRPEAD